MYLDDLDDARAHFAVLDDREVPLHNLEQLLHDGLVRYCLPLGELAFVKSPDGHQ